MNISDGRTVTSMHGCSLINKMKGILWGTLLQCQNIVYIMSIFPNQCQRGRMQLSSSFFGSKIKLSVFNLVSDNLCLNIPSWLPLNIPLKFPFCLGSLYMKILIQLWTGLLLTAGKGAFCSKMSFYISLHDMQVQTCHLMSSYWEPKFIS